MGMDAVADIKPTRLHIAECEKQPNGEHQEVSSTPGDAEAMPDGMSSSEGQGQERNWFLKREPIATWRLMSMLAW